MKLFWIGSWLVGLVPYEVFWQYKPWCDDEGRFWQITLPWCWLSRRWMDMRRRDREWRKYCEEKQ